MPGLSGKVTGAEFPIHAQESIIESFRGVHALRGVRFAESSLVTPRCAILHLQTGLLASSVAQPAWSPDRGTCLFLEGEVFNLDELQPRSRTPVGAPPCEVLLSLLTQGGAAAARILDGQFNIVLYEERANRLTIVNDRLSSKPLYYFEAGAALIFGSEKKSILAILDRSPAVDAIGLLQMFLYRHNLAGRTFLEGLRRLPPSSELVFQEGRLSVRCYESLRFEPGARLPPAGKLAEEWGESLKTDMRRRLRGKERVLLSLSGGLDSRAFTCAIAREFRPLGARTRGSDDSPDYLCAREIAARLNIDHWREEPEDTPYSAFIARAVWRTECEVTFTHCFSIAGHEEIKRRGDIIVAGQSGEIVAGGHIYPYMLVPRAWRSFVERAHDWYILHPESRLRQVFNAEFLARTLPAARESFLASFDRHEGDSNVDRYQAWDLLERQARMTLSAGPVDSHRFEKIYALIGRTYTDFALRLPVRLRYGQTLYQCMIRRLGPEVAHVPYANTNLRLRGTVLGNLASKGLFLAGKAQGRVLRRLGLRARIRAGEGAVPYGRPVRRDPELRRILEGFLASSCFDDSIFNRAGIEQLLSAEYSGAPSQEHLICLFATFAVGLPYFAYRSRTSCPSEADSPG